MINWKKSIGVLLLLLIMAGGLIRINLDADPLSLLPDAMRAVQGLKLYQKHFVNERELIVVIKAGNPDAAKKAASILAARMEAQMPVQAVWQPPWNEHPGDMAELIACLWLNQPPQVFAGLTNRLSAGNVASVLSDAREQLATSLSPMDLARLSYDPLGLTRLPESAMGGVGAKMGLEDGFASQDGLVRLVFLESRQPLGNYRQCARWLKQVETVARQCEQQPDWPGNIQVRFTGAPAFLAEIATGMERDMQGSAISTLLLIAVLFWLVHRSWWPLVTLMGMLLLGVAGTLAVGGWLLHSLNAISLGFAAILMGLAVDYGLVLYEESRAFPDLTAAQLRQRVGGDIFWSAFTTAGAFAMLHFGGMPGLSQLGLLVAAGVMLGAAIMLYVYVPLFLRMNRNKSRAATENASGAPPSARGLLYVRAGTVALAGVAAVVLFFRFPVVDHSTRTLQPRHSQAQSALEEMQQALGVHEDDLWLVVRGRDESAVAGSLDSLNLRLSQLQAEHQINGYMLPVGIWPHPGCQQTNRVMAGRFAEERERLRTGVKQAGFGTNAFMLAESVLETWRKNADSPRVMWLTNASCKWLFKRAIAHDGTRWLAAGSVQPGRSGGGVAAELSQGGGQTWVAGWNLLGEQLLQHVEKRVVFLVLGMALVVGASLWLSFRRIQEMVLSCAVLVLGIAVLLAVMGLLGWSWNLMNMMALPLILGAGVDYTMHVQHALRRYQGNISMMRGITGRAVFLCAGTTVAGFGSNAWSGNSGLASLGLVCSAGIAIVYLLSVFLLPAWWHWLLGGRAISESSRMVTPSSFYGAKAWKAGLFLAAHIPRTFLYFVACRAADCYMAVKADRRKVVQANLLPVCNGDFKAAARATRQLFRLFAIKIVDLWRYEGGDDKLNLVTMPDGWDVFDGMRANKRGIILVTPHLGNWELGGPLLAQRGVKLIVLTQAEPENELTEMRKVSRAKWGIETIVVGENAFAFLEVIKRLQDGEIVALLLDRPMDRSAVEVELFGRPFKASIAAAELARASGCGIVGVSMVREEDHYLVSITSEYPYDRRALGSREARRQLTQEIMRSFEPLIRKHPDQWFHFVDVWSPQSSQVTPHKSNP